MILSSSRTSCRFTNAKNLVYSIHYTTLLHLTTLRNVFYKCTALAFQYSLSLMKHHINLLHFKILVYSWNTIPLYYNLLHTLRNVLKCVVAFHVSLPLMTHSSALLHFLIHVYSWNTVSLYYTLRHFQMPLSVFLSLMLFPSPHYTALLHFKNLVYSWNTLPH